MFAIVIRFGLSKNLWKFRTKVSVHWRRSFWVKALAYKNHTYQKLCPSIIMSSCMKQQNLGPNNSGWELMTGGQTPSVVQQPSEPSIAGRGSAKQNVKQKRKQQTKLSPHLNSKLRERQGLTRTLGCGSRRQHKQRARGHAIIQIGRLPRSEQWIGWSWKVVLHPSFAIDRPACLPRIS